MSDGLRAFLHRFVFPLFEGGTLRVGAPMSTRELRRLLGQADALYDQRLLELRRRRAEFLVPHGIDEAPGPDELQLWAGLYNILALDHPDLDRVWVSERGKSQLERDTQNWTSLHPTQDRQELLARHVCVGAFLEILRDDLRIAGDQGDQLFYGQLPARVRRGFINGGDGTVSMETVRWIETDAQPSARAAFDCALWSSPLTCFLRPDLAPHLWSPLRSTTLLEHPPLLRAIIYRWDRHPDWLELGSAMLSRLPGFVNKSGETRAELTQDGERPTLAALPGQVQEPPPGALSQVICALIHLHVLKVLDFDVRIGVGRSARDESMQRFLCLPLALDLLQERWGSPLNASAHPQLHRRWSEYLAHLDSMLPREMIESTRELISNAPSIQGSAA